MKEALSCDYVQISVVGKDVPHVHVHLIPRYFHDELHEWERKQYTSNEEMSAWAKKITSSV
jgi:diadenosine tetraphosphate (Ap4A) HIT family hydrolase